MKQIVYPETRRVDITDEFFGQKIEDPYQWLESSASSDPNVADWIEAQNALTAEHLGSLPGRDVFCERMTALQNYEKFTVPRERGRRYFYTCNRGLSNQSVLVVRLGSSGADRVLIDPNTSSEHGRFALAEWSPSEDGNLVAYAMQENGSDWMIINVVDVATGAVKEDAIRWVRFTSIAWASDSSGFFYSRYPAPDSEKDFQAALANHAVYFHELGTGQAEDKLIYETPDRPELIHFPEVSSSGRFVLISSTSGAQGNSLAVIDLNRGWNVRSVITRLDSEWTLIGDVDSILYLMTSQDAERRKVVTLDMDAANLSTRDLIPEDPAVLGDARMVGGRLILTYLADVKSELRRYTLDGKPDGQVPLPGIGSAGGFQGHSDSNEAFFVFTSFNSPTTIYRYDVLANKHTVWAAPSVDVELDRIVVEQRFYPSKGGVQVPMFLIWHADTLSPAPTLLHGYGGFGISMISAYEPALLAWVEQGGIVAIANVRGGGEYGKAWHNAGRLENKQTSFDDFAAAATYLHDQGIAPKDGLAVHGESNGGLLVAAVVNQNPELFAAALPGVGVMDMLRFNRFTGGYLWIGEFGDPANEAHFRTLIGYSPYHNVEGGKRYPAILATTADSDDRVVPAHTFKYISALQAVDAGPLPHLVRIEVQAGHGAGRPTSQAIQEMADKWAFAARWTGLNVQPDKSSVLENRGSIE